MKRPCKLLLAASLSMAMTGCGPRLSDEDLGKVVDRVPDIPGADRPYPLHGTESSEQTEDDGHGHAHDHDH